MDRRTDMLPWRSPLVCRASRGVTTSIAKIRNGSTERTKHAWPPMYWVFMTYVYVYNTYSTRTSSSSSSSRPWGRSCVSCCPVLPRLAFPTRSAFFRSRLGVWVFFCGEIWVFRNAATFLQFSLPLTTLIP